MSDDISGKARTQLRKCGKRMFACECEYLFAHENCNAAAYLKAKYGYTDNSAATKASACRALLGDKALFCEALRQIARHSDKVDDAARQKAKHMLLALGGS